MNCEKNTLFCHYNFSCVSAMYLQIIIIIFFYVSIKYHNLAALSHCTFILHKNAHNWSTRQVIYGFTLSEIQTSLSTFSNKTNCMVP